MVCARCIEAVTQIAHEIGLKPTSIILGEISFNSPLDSQQMHAFREELEVRGFAINETEHERLINQVKSLIIERIHFHSGDTPLKLSAELMLKTHCDYSRLSKLFSATEGITIERYATLQRVEKVKEFLVYEAQTISEIADALCYSSPAHLTTQFKNVTGMTPSQFRALGASGRRALDAVSEPTTQQNNVKKAPKDVSVVESKNAIIC